MFIDLGNRVALTDEQFQEEMAKRREKLQLTKNDVVIGCPLCLVMPPPPATADDRQAQDSSEVRSRRTLGFCFESLCFVFAAASVLACQRLGAQSLTYTRGQNVSPAYEGWEQDAGRREVFPLRLHEPELGRGDRRAGRSRQRLQRRRRRSGPADAFPAAAQPLRLPRAGARRISPKRTSSSGR